MQARASDPHAYDALRAARLAPGCATHQTGPSVFFPNAALETGEKSSYQDWRVWWQAKRFSRLSSCAGESGFRSVRSAARVYLRAEDNGG